MIPDGFIQFAQSCLNGNGGIVATAYSKNIEGEKNVLITIDDPVTDPITTYNLGPIPVRSITTLNHIIQDIIFLNKLVI